MNRSLIRTARLALTGLFAAGLAAGLVAGVATSPALGAITATAPSGGCDTVHVGPVQVGHSTGSYFTLPMKPGTTLQRQLLVANPSGYRCSVTLHPAYGKTALNSGDTYVAVSGASSCVESSCWLSGLPGQVTLRAHSRQRITFTVRVPAGMASGQYLAGILAEPGDAASGTTAKPGVSARVVARVAIGVAVVVQGQLSPHLIIPNVTLDTTSSTLGATINVIEADTGNTWEHPAGTIVLDGKKQVTLPVVSNTVLASGQATLQVPTQNIASGQHPTRVELWYDNHKKVAVWEGILTFPSPPKVTTHNGVTTVVLADTAQHGTSIPGWLIGVMILGGLALLALLFFLILLLRRRRREEEDPRVVIEGRPLQAIPELTGRAKR